MLYALAQSGLDERLVLAIEALLLIAFLAWIVLAVRWSRKSYLERIGQSRRIAAHQQFADRVGR
jgi:hypothetical protein